MSVFENLALSAAIISIFTATQLSENFLLSPDSIRARLPRRCCHSWRASILHSSRLALDCGRMCSISKLPVHAFEPALPFEPSSCSNIRTSVFAKSLCDRHRRGWAEVATCSPARQHQSVHVAHGILVHVRNEHLAHSPGVCHWMRHCAMCSQLNIL